MSRWRLAAWACVLLVVLGGAYALHRAHARAAALEDRFDKAKLDGLATERQAVQAEAAALAASRAQLQGQVVSLQRQAAALEARVATLTTKLATQEQAGRRLVERGTVDEVVAAGKALGFHPVGRAP